MTNIKKQTTNKYEVKKILVKLYGSKCYYCDNYFSIKDLTLDHIYPVSKIGKKNKTNKASCVLACDKCNRKKSDRIICIEDFRKETMGSRYYPLTEFKTFYTKYELIKQRREYENKKIAKRLKRKIEYAQNVVYPKNPIVKQKWTFKRFIKKICGKVKMLKNTFSKSKTSHIK